MLDLKRCRKFWLGRRALVCVEDGRLSERPFNDLEELGRLRGGVSISSMADFRFAESAMRLVAGMAIIGVATGPRGSLSTKLPTYSLSDLLED